MSKIIDIIGKTFGYLTVIERVEDRIYPSGSSEPQYLCKCVCGNEIIKESRALRKAKTKLSCGCIKEHYSFDGSEDLTNKRFGKLFVVFKVDDDDNWYCKCDCGGDGIFTRIQLKGGHVKNCGCENLYTPKTFKDLTGQRFGRLSVLYRDKNDKSGHVKWICQCDCGKILSVYKDALLNGRQVSCGCYKKEIKQTQEFRDSIKLYNKYDLSGEYGIGICSNTGKEFYFDKEDYELIKNYTWREDANGYIVASVERNTKHPTMVFLHRIVMGLTENDNVEVDHVGHNTYDNRKKVLRIVNHSQNESNRVIMKNNTSGVPGVSWSNKDGLWVALIGKDNKMIRIGSYSDFNDAVAARKAAEELYFGEYSFDNSIKKYKREIGGHE